MAFAFNPDDGPPRLIRFVEPGTLPGEDILSVFIKAKNLLIIDREHYARLPKVDQHILIRSREPCLSVTLHSDRTPTIAPIAA